MTNPRYGYDKVAIAAEVRKQLDERDRELIARLNERDRITVPTHPDPDSVDRSKLVWVNKGICP